MISPSMAAAVLLVTVGLADGAVHRHEPRNPLAKYCPLVNAARAAGLSDDQIASTATAMGVSAEGVAWAKKNCIVAKS
jgi:hypothetical protein